MIQILSEVSLSTENKETPVYSVCIPNYNMADTLEQALRTILDQLNTKYEVLVVDDGSTDNSLAVLEKLSTECEILRYISLARDRKRKLGETRNYSVEHALGEYVILHVDADDLWEPYIQDFVSVFHRIEQCLERDFLLSGQQINIAKRSFLLKHGPYRNLGRLEDRDLWTRLAGINAYIPLDHRVFRTRMKRPRKRTFRKVINSTWDRLSYDLRGNSNSPAYLLANLFGIFYSKWDFSFRYRLLRTILIIPVFVTALFQESLAPPENMEAPQAFAQYREQTRGTYAEIMERQGCDPSLDFLKGESRKIFLERPQDS